MRRVKTVTPAAVDRIGSATHLVRLPEYCTGWARIVFPEAKKGQNITVRYFQRERERANGLKLTANNNSGEVYELQTYTYNPKGTPGEVYEPKFSYSGFELIEISGYKGELKPVPPPLWKAGILPSCVPIAITSWVLMTNGSTRIWAASKTPETATRP
jgi:hypothetical protein